MDDLEEQLERYINKPGLSLRIGHAQIGRDSFEDVQIGDANGAAHFLAMLRETKTLNQRRRFDRSGHAYPQNVERRLYPKKLSAEIETFLAFRANEGIEPETVDKVERALVRLLAVCGDVYVSAITADDILQLQEYLKWGAHGREVPRGLKPSDIEALIETGKQENAKPLADSTMDLDRKFLSTFFSRLVESGKLSHSPMSVWKKKRGKRVQDPTKEVRLFSDAELQKIFSPELFVPWAKKWPHRWWAPILCLYSGARVNEIAQVKLSDIVQIDGRWWLHIRATVDDDLRGSRGPQSRARVKCKSSIRCIPIAQPVLDAGFLDYVRDLKAAQAKRLFPNLSAGVDTKTGLPKGRYAKGLINQFGKYMKGLGFAEGVRSHAFRHTFTTFLMARGIKSVDIARVTGHSTKGKEIVVEEVLGYAHVGHPKRPEREPEVKADIEFVRERQLLVVDNYLPPVEMPRYARGQFRNCLGFGAKLYP